MTAMAAKPSEEMSIGSAPAVPGKYRRRYTGAKEGAQQGSFDRRRERDMYLITF